MEKLPSTVEECHEVIRTLLKIVDRVDMLTTRIAQLESENAALKEQLATTSENSSLPPSQDRKQKKTYPKRKSSGKPSGGQVGHKGHYRTLLPLEAVDKVKYCDLPSHCVCGGKLRATAEHVRHQVHELPVLKLEVTEYQLAKGSCEACQKKHIADLPEGISWGITGSRLTSFMSALVSKYGLSRREQKAFLAEQFGFRISLGTVFNKQKLVNKALAKPISDLLPMVKTGSHIYADETGHKRDGKRQWLWGFIGLQAAYFAIEASRGKKVLSKALGDYDGMIISDRYSAYNQFDSGRRQLCWAHLKRDFNRLSEKSDVVLRRIGKQLLTQTSELFHLWHRFKEGKLSRYELMQRASPIRRQIGELLEQGSYTEPKLRVARFCKNLLENFDALWNFLEVENIEPTNNTAERALRHNVIWRKKYFCTRSDYGSEFVARSASFNATCKLQEKNSFQLLCQIIKDHFSNQQQDNYLVACRG